MATFILVSGAWHAGWCWSRITPLLEAAGHRAVAPDLLGMGADPTPLAEVTLAGWADQVADLVRRQEEPVVLVGHSRGGVVISEAAERAPSHIASLVYLAAFLLPHGARLGDAINLKEGEASAILRAGPDNTTTVDPALVQAVFYNTTPDAWVRTAERSLGPEPMDAFFAELTVTPERFGTVPRAYIECLQDQAVPIALQRTMQAGLPCTPVATLDTDHSPFFSDPQALTAALLSIAEAAGHG